MQKELGQNMYSKNSESHVLLCIIYDTPCSNGRSIYGCKVKNRFSQNKSQRPEIWSADLFWALFMRNLLRFQKF